MLLNLIASVFIIFIIIAGAFNFPYIPMFFGVYGADRHSVRGRLIVALLWLFPIISLLSLVFIWSLSVFFIFIPVVNIFLLFFLRVKGNDQEVAQYNSKENNISELNYQIEDICSGILSSEAVVYILYKIILPEGMDFDKLKVQLLNEYKAGVKFKKSDKAGSSEELILLLILPDDIADDCRLFILSVFDLVWSYGCKVASVSVVDDYCIE